MFIKLGVSILWIIIGLFYVTGALEVSRLAYAAVWIALIVNLIGGLV